MLEPVKAPYSPAAADAADRLRLLKHDIHVIELAVGTVCFEEDDDREALTMMLRRMIGEVESLSDDILTADRKGAQS